MSLNGPKFDGCYQAVFFDALDAWSMIRTARRRAIAEGYEVAGAITLQRHQIGSAIDPREVVVATVSVVLPERAEREEAIA